MSLQKIIIKKPDADVERNEVNENKKKSKGKRSIDVIVLIEF